MRRKATSLLNKSLLILLILSSVVTIVPIRTQSIDPYFTLVIKLHGGGYISDYGNLLKQNLAEIGINLDVIVVDFSTFLEEVFFHRNFDLTYFALSSDDIDPDMSTLFCENGSLNIFGYDTSMDSDDSLGLGLPVNEWYLRHGVLIMPPDSQERIQHYWDWEDYLMDSLCPILPLFSMNTFSVFWNNLANYDYNYTLKQNWGHLEWIGTHTGQNSTDDIVISDAAWNDLNPLFQDNPASHYISSQCLDPLIWCDPDSSYWPHLADSYTYLNDTTILIETRDGINWKDYDTFIDEPFDVEDVYFTLYAWKYLSNNQQAYDWIEEMKMVGDEQLYIYVDGNATTLENEPYYLSLNSLNVDVLPEHFLNQTQTVDGVTPDITHVSWLNFSNDCFGTSLFELSNFVEDNETVLSVNPNCWWLDSFVDKSNMDFVNRFGIFSDGYINQQRVRIIPDSQISLLEFEAGKVDIETFPFGRFDEHYKYVNDPTKSIGSAIDNVFSFFGFNMLEVRPNIGDRTPCPGDSTITKGLAIRKAICYATNREEINQILHDGERNINHWPIYPGLDIWCNPKIIKYDYNLATAKYYMQLAGYPETNVIGFAFTVTIGFLFCTFITIFFLNRKLK